MVSTLLSVFLSKSLQVKVLWFDLEIAALYLFYFHEV